MQFGFDDGWLEPEYNPRTARSWRWMSESAALQVHHAGRDVTITLHGESPLRYYDDAPTLRIIAGTTTVAEMRPESDFTLEAKVPAALLDQTAGRIVVQSSEFFVPGDRDAVKLAEARRDGGHLPVAQAPKLGFLGDVQRAVGRKGELADDGERRGTRSDRVMAFGSRPAFSAQPRITFTFSAYSAGYSMAGRRIPMGCQASASSPVRRSATSVWPPTQIGMPPA